MGGALNIFSFQASYLGDSVQRCGQAIEMWASYLGIIQPHFWKARVVTQIRSGAPRGRAGCRTMASGGGK